MMATIGQLRRLMERLPDGRKVIHIDGWDGDARTLCGYAHEGAAVTGEPDNSLVEVPRGKINCAVCLRIVYFCKAIPKGPLLKVERKEEAARMIYPLAH